MNNRIALFVLVLSLVLLPDIVTAQTPSPSPTPGYLLWRDDPTNTFPQYSTYTRNENRSFAANGEYGRTSIVEVLINHKAPDNIYTQGACAVSFDISYTHTNKDTGLPYGMGLRVGFIGGQQTSIFNFDSPEAENWTGSVLIYKDGQPTDYPGEWDKVVQKTDSFGTGLDGIAFNVGGYRPSHAIHYVDVSNVFVWCVDVPAPPTCSGVVEYNQTMPGPVPSPTPDLTVTPSSTVTPTLTTTPDLTPTPQITHTEVMTRDMNILQNASFEDGAINFAPHWSDIPGDEYFQNHLVLTGHPDGVPDGNNLLTFDSSSDGTLPWIYQRFQHEDADYYYYCFIGSGLADTTLLLNDGTQTFPGYQYGSSYPGGVSGAPDEWTKFEGVIEVFSDSPNYRDYTFGLEVEDGSGFAYVDNFVLAPSDSDGNIIAPEDTGLPVPTATNIYQTITPVPTFPGIDLVDDTIVMGGGDSPFAPIDHGSTCWSIGPFDFSFGSDASGNPQDYEGFGFELCLHEWEWVFDFLDYSISTALLGFVIGTGVVMVWIRQR